MNNVYFSTEGLSSSEANFLANKSKELIQSAEERLNSVRFFDISVAVIGNNEKQIMSTGNTDLGFIELDLKEIASMNAFCAWIREAIKEKESQLSEVKTRQLIDWTKESGIELPVCPKMYKDPEIISEEDVINSWDVNKRNKYLKLEAFAATFGKYIHPNGSYSKARKEAHIAFNNPITKEGAGRDMILYYRKPSVNINDVDYVFMKLQEQYREYEQELNCMKAEIKETVNKFNLDIYAKFAENKAEYDSKYNDYEVKMAELRNEFNKWKTSETERISKLKITIPNELKETFKIIKEAQ